MKVTETRKRTDALLSDVERRIDRVYASSPALKRIQKELDQFMAGVQKRTQSAYDAWKNADDDADKDALKKAYTDAVRAETMGSKEYQALIKRFCKVLAETNQEAVEISNSAMRQVYAMNYNEVAGDCYDVGIKVVRADG